MEYNERGEELPDDTPVEVPLHFRRPPSLQDSIKAMIRGEMSRQAALTGQESFEEADDFGVDDEEELVSPYEMSVMQEEKVLTKDADGDILDSRSNNGAKESQDGKRDERRDEGEKRGAEQRGARVNRAGNGGSNRDGEKDDVKGNESSGGGDS